MSKFWGSAIGVVVISTLGMGAQAAGDGARHNLRRANGSGVAHLPHGLRPRAAEDVIIRERLQSRRLAHREIADGAIRAREHVLSTRHAVIARLECLGRSVEPAAGVSLVGPRSRIVAVFWKRVVGETLWGRGVPGCGGRMVTRRPPPPAPNPPASPLPLRAPPARH